MSNRKVCGLALLIGFVIGCAVGYKEARDVTKGGALLGSMASEGGYGELAFLQDRHAGPAQAREALLGFIHFSESIEAMPNGRKNWIALYDRGTAYKRLARLETESGNTDLSRQYVHLAYESYRAAGRHISEEDIAKSVTTSKRSENPSPRP